MKKRLSVRISSVLLSLLLAASCVACSENTNNSSASSDVTATGSTQVATETTNTDPLGKYDPPIELTCVGLVASDYQYLADETFEDNAFTRAYRDELGINLKYIWYTDSSQYDQKLSLAMASDDLPDIFRVTNPNDFAALKINDQLADLTDAYQKYASQSVKDVLEFDSKAFELLHYDGKLVATGMPNNIYEGILQLFIRQDWLDNLGLAAPKTMDDVLNIADQFTNNDPDKNGKKDTYGLSVYKDIKGGGVGDFNGIFNAYHAYPSIWVKGDNDSLVYGSLQPEMKTALTVMQEMYKKGYFNKEFGTMDGAAAVAQITEGKVGMEFGLWWNPAWPLADNMTKDPNAIWRPYPIVSADNNPVKGTTAGGLSSYFVASKKCKNPEALIKLSNWFMMAQQPENTEKYHDVFFGPESSPRQSDGQALAFGQLYYPDQNYRLATAMSDAISKKDPSSLTADVKASYDKAMKWVETQDRSDPQNYVQYINFGSGDISAKVGVIGSYMKNESYMINEFLGSPTPTMIDKKAILDKMEIETITKIIMGESVDSYDKFISDWKSLGGDEITKEVNEWYLSQK